MVTRQLSAGPLGGLSFLKERLMSWKYAVPIFLCVCLTLAILVITNIISTILCGLIFAIALMLVGGLSKGFRKDKQ